MHERMRYSRPGDDVMMLKLVQRNLAQLSTAWSSMRGFSQDMTPRKVEEAVRVGTRQHVTTVRAKLTILLLPR